MNDKETVLENLKVQSEQETSYTKEYEKVQYETLKYANEKFDKNVLFIASGALTLSMGFLKEIVPDPNHIVSKGVIVTAWSFFGATIFIALLSSFIAILANRWAIRFGGVMEDLKYEKITKRWNYTIRSFYVGMILLLLFGMILVILFVARNYLNT